MTIADVLAGRARYHVEHCRAEELEQRLPDGCVDLILTDPPFHKVKDLGWDREHKTAGGFLDWIGERFAAWRRVLAPNGSLYVFASPGMAWNVEGKVREHFSVLNRVTWVKAEGTHRRQDEEACRLYFPQTEAVIFAEHAGSLPLATTLREARIAAGMSQDELDRRIGRVRRSSTERGTGIVRMWETYPHGTGSCVPRREEYEAAMRACGVATPPPYEDVTRPFAVSGEVPYTDVWTYPTVNTYAGKHPCEKPAAMALDIVRASSREGGLVLDLFTGSGKFPAAAVALKRRALACDMDAAWREVARERCRVAEETGALIDRISKRAPKDAAPPSGVRANQLDLFAA